MRRLLCICCALGLSGCFLDRTVTGEPLNRQDASIPHDSGPRDASPHPPGDATVPADAFTPVDAFVPVDACTPHLEICDGADNDCDLGTIDGSRDPDVGAECDGEDADACEEGRILCVEGVEVCSDGSDDTLERCNGVDDDCDGRVDEGNSLCPCPHHARNGHHYLFCAGAGNWGDDVCPPGYELASINDRDEHRFIVMHAGSPAGDWWIGGRRNMDGELRWRDGSRIPVGDGRFSNWQTGAPDGSGNCIELDPDEIGEAGIAGSWNDAQCWQDNNYICEAP